MEIVASISVAVSQHPYFTPRFGGLPWDFLLVPHGRSQDACDCVTDAILEHGQLNLKLTHVRFVSDTVDVPVALDDGQLKYPRVKLIRIL